MEDSKGLSIKFEQVWKSPPQLFPATHFLSVDETKRSRASSDPGGLHICIVPEITITTEDGRNSDCTEDVEFNSFLLPPQQRPRSNTCPEEMFRTRKGRPPTPPPEDAQKFRSQSGKRFSFNFSPKDINGISFAQHRLSKVSEETAEQRQRNVQTRKSSLQTQINIHFSSPDFSCGKDDNGNKTDNQFSQLKREANSSKKDSVDLYGGNLSVTMSRNSDNTTSSDKSIQHRDDTSDVITCSSGNCRSKKDGRENLDDDHLIAY